MKQQVVPNVGNSGLPYKSRNINMALKHSFCEKRSKGLNKTLPKELEKGCTKSAHLCAFNEFCFELLTYQDLYGSPLIPTLGTTCCFMR